MPGTESTNYPEPESPVAPAKRREKRSIKDIIIDRPYGELSFSTEPSVLDVFQAITSNTLEERHYQNDVEELYAEFQAQAGGNPTIIVRLVQEYHARRVAYFVVHGWNDYIGLNAEGAVRDGSHRLRAAMFMGKKEVDVEIG